jgi:hypothetical protein
MKSLNLKIIGEELDINYAEHVIIDALNKKEEAVYRKFCKL